jgi:hypothetical protein
VSPFPRGYVTANHRHKKYRKNEPIALNKAIGVYSPTVFKVIEFVQKADADQEREMAQLALGAAPKRRKSKYVAVDEAIARLTDQTFGHALPSIANILQYLDAVAYQLWDSKR